MRSCDRKSREHHQIYFIYFFENIFKITTLKHATRLQGKDAQIKGRWVWAITPITSG